MDEVRANFDVNVFGLLEVTQAVLLQMKKQHSGSIINLASISGTVTGPAQGIYSATKAAVIMMSEVFQPLTEFTSLQFALLVFGRNFWVNQ